MLSATTEQWKRTCRFGSAEGFIYANTTAPSIARSMIAPSWNLYEPTWISWRHHGSSKSAMGVVFVNIFWPHFFGQSTVRFVRFWLLNLFCFPAFSGNLSSSPHLTSSSPSLPKGFAQVPGTRNSQSEATALCFLPRDSAVCFLASSARLCGNAKAKTRNRCHVEDQQRDRVLHKFGFCFSESHDQT